MSDRLIRDEIIHSQRYWSVSDEAKILFFHLLLSVDDTARYSGNNFTIRSRCFPSRGMEAQRLDVLLEELMNQDLIRLYDNGDERYIFIPRFKQKCRYINSKYPEPPKDMCDLLVETDKDGKVYVIQKTGPSPAQVTRREVKTREKKRNISTKSFSSGKLIPEDFSISEATKEWATKNRVYKLDKHFDYFASRCKAKGYLSDDWDAYFRNAITDDWAKIGPNPIYQY